jgi:hypothetical protein
MSRYSLSICQQNCRFLSKFMNRRIANPPSTWHEHLQLCQIQSPTPASRLSLACITARQIRRTKGRSIRQVQKNAELYVRSPRKSSQNHPPQGKHNNKPMTSPKVGRPRNGSIQCVNSRRYARPASRFPARPDSFPCSRRQIAYDVARVLGVSRLGSTTADGIGASKQLGVVTSAAEGCLCDAVSLAAYHH